MTNTPRSRLIVERLSESGQTRQQPHEPEQLALDGARRLEPHALALRPLSAHPLALDSLYLEPVLIGQYPSVFMVTSPELSVRVNGELAPRLCVLQLKDEVQVNGVVLHVSFQHEPRLGPPTQEHLGRDCPVCRLPIVADTRVLVCEGCGEALHLEPESVPEDERLDCALLSLAGCPSCQNPLRLESGLSYTPEL